MPPPLSVASAKRTKPAAAQACVVKSAARVLRILEFFDRRRGAANVHAVAVALGYPASSTGALLRSLVATGYLHYDRLARTYAPTLRVTLLGADWVAPRLTADGRLLHLMTALAERSSGTAALVARNGDVAEFIHAIGPLRGRLAARPGRSLIASCIGHALLAALPEKEVRGLLHRLNAAALDAGAATLRAADLLDRLARLRRRGHAEAVEEGEGVMAATLPFDESGGPYAVAVLLPAAEFLARRDALGPMLREEMRRHLLPAGPPLRWPGERAAIMVRAA